MPPKKKSRRKSAKPKIAVARKKSKTAAKTKAKTKAKPKKQSAKVQSRRKSAVQKTSSKKAAPKREASSKASLRNPESETKRDVQQDARRRKRVARSPALDEQSGDLQGISRAEQDDSESIEELVEEGNAFEAGAVAGVEEADNADEREVRTHELPEDDVPEEYWDKE
jgi:hypothetical protein